MTLNFKKTKEDFVCENCGTEVKGNGYTNHCPKCLWSKHVDNFPGDREALCFGMMEPIDTLEEGGEWSVIHRCKNCKKEQKNKISKEDDFDLLVKIKQKRNFDK